MAMTARTHTHTHTHTHSLAFWQSAKTFFCRLLSPELSQGTRDYYTAMLFFDILCFLTIVFGVNSFGVSVCVCVFLCTVHARLLIIALATRVDSPPLSLFHRSGFRVANKLPWQSTFVPIPYPSPSLSCSYFSFYPCSLTGKLLGTSNMLTGSFDVVLCTYYVIIK